MKLNALFPAIAFYIFLFSGQASASFFTNDGGRMDASMWDEHIWTDYSNTLENQALYAIDYNDRLNYITNQDGLGTEYQPSVEYSSKWILSYANDWTISLNFHCDYSQIFTNGKERLFLGVSHYNDIDHDNVAFIFAKSSTSDYYYEIMTEQIDDIFARNSIDGQFVIDYMSDIDILTLSAYENGNIVASRSISNYSYGFEYAVIWFGGKMTNISLNYGDAYLYNPVFNTTEIHSTPIPGASFLLCFGIISILGLFKKK